MHRILNHIKNVCIGWLLSILIFILYGLCIVTPSTWFEQIEDSKLQLFIFIPAHGILFLGPFILLYQLVRISDYTKFSLVKLWLTHVIGFIPLLASYVFIFTEKSTPVGEFIIIISSISFYFLFHTYSIKFFIKRFKLLN